MKYLFTFILVIIFLVTLVATANFQRKQGYASGVEMGKLKAESEYLTKKKKFVDSFYNDHKLDKALFDSLRYEVLRQGQEAKEINRKLVKKFGL